MPRPVHGNYARYYGMRAAAAAAAARRGARVPRTDERIAALVAWLAACGRRPARILDVGCNAAKPLIELCQAVGPDAAVGVDIDAALVAAARAAVHAAWSQAAPPAPGAPGAAPQWSYFPAGFSALFGSLPLPADGGAFPRNVHLVAGDWVMANAARSGEAGAALAAHDAAGYDLILCLSLTKWVHLQHGDGGLVRLLARAALTLRDGGALVLEAQPWRAYEQARALSRELRAAHARLALRPDDMGWWLSAFGLACVAELQHAGAGQEFSRPVRVYVKNAPPDALNLAHAAAHWTGALPCAWVTRDAGRH